MSRKKRQQSNPQQQSIDSVDDIEGKLQQAISFYQSSQFQQAEEICQQILRDNSQHAEALHLLGIIAHKIGDYRIATSLITQAIEIDSNQSSFFYDLGNALREQGRLEESIDAYQKAIKINPTYIEAYNNLGNVLKKQEKIHYEATHSFSNHGSVCIPSGLWRRRSTGANDCEGYHTARTC